MNRCFGRTLQGRRCKREAIKDGRYCFQHSGDDLWGLAPLREGGVMGGGLLPPVETDWSIRLLDLGEATDLKKANDQVDREWTADLLRELQEAQGASNTKIAQTKAKIDQIAEILVQSPTNWDLELKLAS